MSRYRVYLTATVSRPVEVEADTEADALDQAEMEGGPSLCHQCASSWDMGDAYANESNIETIPNDQD